MKIRLIIYSVLIIVLPFKGYSQEQVILTLDQHLAQIECHNELPAPMGNPVNQG